MYQTTGSAGSSETMVKHKHRDMEGLRYYDIYMRLPVLMQIVILYRNIHGTTENLYLR